MGRSNEFARDFEFILHCFEAYYEGRYCIGLKSPLLRKEGAFPEDMLGHGHNGSGLTTSYSGSITV